MDKINKIKEKIIFYLKGEDEFLAPDEKESIETMLRKMADKYNYNDQSISDTIHYLMKNYDEVKNNAE